MSTEPAAAHLGAIQEYGTRKKFSERLDALEEAAFKFFVDSYRSHQAIEGDLHALVVRVRAFSDRRNEVAHGKVVQLRYHQPFMHIPTVERGVIQYALMPPMYTIRKFAQITGVPTYTYTSVELLQFAWEFTELAYDLESFYEHLESKEERR